MFPRFTLQIKCSAVHAIDSFFYSTVKVFDYISNEMLIPLGSEYVNRQGITKGRRQSFGDRHHLFETTCYS